MTSWDDYEEWRNNVLEIKVKINVLNESKEERVLFAKREKEY